MSFSRYSRQSYRHYSAPRNPSASVTEKNGSLVINFSYNDDLRLWIKALPKTDWTYSGDDHSWTVHPKHGNALKDAVQRYLGITVTIPQVQASLLQAERIETFEIRYLGGARQRGDEPERTATGCVGGEWKVIFGELALRKWAGEHDAKPGGISTKYGVLGVQQTATADEIKSAYRKMARVTHPDLCKEHDAEQRFRQVNEAYEVLIDPLKRQKYNAGLLLQQSLTGKERVSAQSVYYSPLRCGVITARVQPIVGDRFLVLEILAWKDIVQNGKMLVTTWADGAKTFVEQWVEVTG